MKLIMKVTNDNESPPFSSNEWSKLTCRELDKKVVTKVFSSILANFASLFIVFSLGELISTHLLKELWLNFSQEVGIMNYDEIKLKCEDTLDDLMVQKAIAGSKDDFLGSLDSLSLVNLILTLESCFSISFSDEYLTIDHFKNVTVIINSVLTALSTES